MGEYDPMEQSEAPCSYMVSEFVYWRLFTGEKVLEDSSAYWWHWCDGIGVKALL